MDAKSIKSVMTKGKWYVNHYNETSRDDDEYGIFCDGWKLGELEGWHTGATEGDINEIAICQAVNSTWNAGINPNCVGDMMKLLERSMVFLRDADFEDTANAIEQLLNSAKI